MGSVDRDRMAMAHPATESTPLLDVAASTPPATAPVNHSNHRLCPVEQHDLPTSIVLHVDCQAGILTSASLNEADFSARPFGVDIDVDQPAGLGRSRLVILDILRGLVLCLQLVDVAAEFLGRTSTKNYPSWHQSTRLPLLSHSAFIIHLVTLVCVPCLHFLLGCGAVLAINTRRTLGWSSLQLIWRSLKLAIVLLFLNQLLMSQELFQARGQVLVIMLPIWSLGINLVLITILLTSLFEVHHAILSRLVKSHPAIPILSLDQLVDHLGPSPRFFNKIADILLVFMGLAMPLIIGYMLPGQRDGPDLDWWIDWAQARSWWFWFLVTPTPNMESHPRSYLISTYAPLGWFPYVVLGAAYGRTFIRKHRTKSAHFARHLSLALSTGLLFMLTRLFDIGNHSLPIPPTNNNATSTSGPTMTTTVTKSDLPLALAFPFLTGNWQTLLFTTQFPPDLAHVLLSLTIQFTGFSLLDWVPIRALNFKNNPLLVFGRSSIVFFSLQLLSFHFILPPILTILKWPNVLTVLWSSVVGLSCLPVFWIICETWIIFKDQLPPNSVWRIL